MIWKGRERLHPFIDWFNGNTYCPKLNCKYSACLTKYDSVQHVKLWTFAREAYKSSDNSATKPYCLPFVNSYVTTHQLMLPGMQHCYHRWADWTESYFLNQSMYRCSPDHWPRHRTEFDHFDLPSCKCSSRTLLDDLDTTWYTNNYDITNALQHTKSLLPNKRSSTATVGEIAVNY